MNHTTPTSGYADPEVGDGVVAFEATPSEGFDGKLYAGATSTLMVFER